MEGDLPGPSSPLALSPLRGKRKTVARETRLAGALLCHMHEHELPKGTTVMPFDGAAHGSGRMRAPVKGNTEAPYFLR